MPAGARAFGISLLGLSGALGVGICLMALPLADTGPGGWRLLWFLTLLGLPVVAGIGRLLPESRRFEAPMTRADGRPRSAAVRCWPRRPSCSRSTRRPASQLMNQFLRDERGSRPPASACSASSRTRPGSSAWWWAAASPTSTGVGSSARWPVLGRRPHDGDGAVGRLVDVDAVAGRRDHRRGGHPGARRLRPRAVPHVAAGTGQRAHHRRGGGRHGHRPARGRVAVGPLGRPRPGRCSCSRSARC